MTLGKTPHSPSQETILRTRRLTKTLAIIFTVVVLGVGGLIGFIEYQAKRSREEISALAAQFVPGTSFTSVLNQLGPPTRTLTTPEEIKSLGLRQEPALATNATLHMFMRPGPPYRWLLIYTDKYSRTVSYATWKDI